jgi:putative FmdB family regulatory protein
MPIYDFFCEKCDLEAEIVQSIKDYDGNWTCTSCGNPGRRIYKYCSFHFTGTKIENAEFNPGLGKITKSKRHRDELAKKMGVIEVGNESPDKIHKHFDSTREDKLKKSWDEV